MAPKSSGLGVSRPFDPGALAQALGGGLGQLGQQQRTEALFAQRQQTEFQRLISRETMDAIKKPIVNVTTFYSRLKTEITEWLKITI